MLLPSRGRPFDAAAHPPRRSGRRRPAVLASRDALAATIAPLTGPAAEAMTGRDRAGRAGSRPGFTDPRRAAGAGWPRAWPPSAPRSGPTATAARSARRCGTRGLALVLTAVRIRDDAWARMDPAHRDAHRRLWTDVVRRAQPGYVAAPASLLAFTAWQAATAPWRTSPSSARWPITPATRWPCCSATPSTRARRRPWPPRR